MKGKPEFQCMECGYKFYSAATANWATFEDGCPDCGGSDIDTFVEDPRRRKNVNPSRVPHKEEK